MSTSPVAPPAPKSPTLFGVSKSTIQGVLSLLIVVGLSLQTLQMPSALSTPNSSHILAWVTFAATTIVTVAKAVLAFTQGDATS